MVCKLFYKTKSTKKQTVIFLNTEDIYYFNLLKKAIVVTFLKNNKGSNSIEEWKGEEIILFQEDLYKKLKTKVSEKWFYTYFKNTPEKLPRIDMLNLLSNYVEFKNWNTFKENHRKKNIKTSSKKPIYLYFLISVFTLIGAWKLTQRNNNFQFCFINDTSNKIIFNTSLDIKILQENESPIYYKTDSLGCFNFETKKDYIKFVVQSPYHKTDTIIRYISSNTKNTIKLHTDDYALMLHFYSNGNVKDWSKHKQQLEALISDKAKIYQLFDHNIGIEVYSKEDFIRLITIPTKTLKNIKILYRKVEGNKIVKLKFIVK